MFSGKTTIVVGAGAGIDYGMPLGRDLAATISTNLLIKGDRFRGVTSKNPDILDAVNQLALEENRPDSREYLDACTEIIKGMREANSIDEFIHTRRDDKRIEQCGKVAITYSILEKESKCALYYEQRNVNDTIDFLGLQKTWLPLFRKFVTGDSHADEVSSRLQRITFIVFNYDRCIEHYLIHSLMNYHNLTEQDAAEILNTLKIIHPYGTVGSLPWQRIPRQIEFGGKPRKQLVTLSKGIQTFTEQSEDRDMEDSIHTAMRDADLILFLGFAYHDQNLKLLTPSPAAQNAKIIGTAKEISASDCNILKRRLARRFCGNNAEIVVIDKTYDCTKLFSQNLYRLSD